MQRYGRIVKRIVRRNKNLVTIHSHPSSFPPSIEDFNSACVNNYMFGIVCGHNGNLFVYSSEERIPPETYYYLWDDEVLVGEYRIRHYLTEALKIGAGHIGYSIKKEYRGRGYGTKGLAMVLDIAREIVPEDETHYLMRVKK